MVKVQSGDVGQENRKVWFIIGPCTGLFQATLKYLQSRGQTVLYNSNLENLSDELLDITRGFRCIDMLVVNDLKGDEQLESLVEKIYYISSCMQQDGTSKIIFLISEKIRTNGFENSDLYRTLRLNMKDRFIHVHCFEPSSYSEKNINLGK